MSTKFYKVEFPQHNYYFENTVLIALKKNSSFLPCVEHLFILLSFSKENHYKQFDPSNIFLCRYKHILPDCLPCLCVAKSNTGDNVKNIMNTVSDESSETNFIHLTFMVLNLGL